MAMLQTSSAMRAYLDVIAKRFSDCHQTLENEAPSRSCTSAGRPSALDFLAGENEAARSAAEQALPLLEARLNEIRTTRYHDGVSGWVYLALGRNSDALRVCPPGRPI